MSINLIAETGQVWTHISHLTHLSVILAILKILAGSIALTGHSPTQVLHLTHLVETANISSLVLKSSSSNWKSSPSSSNLLFGLVIDILFDSIVYVVGLIKEEKGIFRFTRA